MNAHEIMESEIENTLKKLAYRMADIEGYKIPEPDKMTLQLKSIEEYTDYLKARLNILIPKPKGAEE